MAPAPLILFAVKEELLPFLAACRTTGASVRRTSRVSWRVTVTGGTSHDVLLSGPGYRNVLGILETVEPTEIIHPGFAGALLPSP